jgi:hypothetical protein
VCSCAIKLKAQAERNYRRALEEFERLKAIRDELPNEPIEDLQPEETEPSAAGASVQAPFPAATPDDRPHLDARSKSQPPPSVDSRS